MATNRNDRPRQTPRSELARTLLAIADPIRLRMLNLMIAGTLSPQQFAQLLGIDERAVSKHLVLFRESKLVVWRTRRNTKYYTLRKPAESQHFPLLSLAIEMLKEDLALRADLAVFMNSQEEVPQSWPDANIDGPNYVDQPNSFGIMS